MTRCATRETQLTNSLHRYNLVPLTSLTDLVERVGSWIVCETLGTPGERPGSEGYIFPERGPVRIKYSRREARF